MMVEFPVVMRTDQSLLWDVAGLVYRQKIIDRVINTDGWYRTPTSRQRLLGVASPFSRM